MRNSKKAAVMILAGALSAGGAFMAFAQNQGTGQWCNGSAEHPADITWTNADGQKVSSWWFAVSADGTQSLANTWHWIKGVDGQMKCYYFDKDGWLVVDGTIDGEKVDANGIYVDASGNAVLGSEDKVYYTASESFLNTAGGTAEGTTDAGNTAGAGSTAGTGTSTGTNVAKGHSTTTPDAAALPFTPATVSGDATKTIRSDFGNYTLTISGMTVEGNTGDDNSDFSASGDAGELSIVYYPLDQYTAGNTSLDAFITEYLKNSRPGAIETNLKSAALTGEKEIGGYVYKQITRTFARPINLTEDFCTYIRQVEGTNYAMVIYTKGSADNFAGVLGTMQKVR